MGNRTRTNVTFSLPRETVERLDAMAAEAQTSRSWLAQRLMQSALEGSTIQIAVTKPAQRLPRAA